MRAAVLGHPIRHSLSPVLHNAAYAALGLTDWQYEAIECNEDGLQALLANSPADEWGGFSCTMPLKRVALELAEEADPLARAVGAANTLLPRPGGRWHAAITDVVGITAALAEAGVSVAGRRVALLGAGGTAQAALAAVTELGAAGCVALVRDRGRTGELHASADRLGVRVRIGALAPDAPELAADLIISTLPARAADPLAERAWRDDQAVLDVAYDPWPSALAGAAARAGATTVSGALMLLHQAAEQVRLMTGATAPIEAMRSALRSAAPAAGI